MSDLSMLAQIFEVLVRLTNAYIRHEMTRGKFIEKWGAMGAAVELVVKDMEEPISLGRILGSRGGLRGGPARAASMTPNQRTAQAKHAAQERWMG